MLAGEFRVAQLINGVELAGFVVVSQPEGMAHLVGNHLAQRGAQNLIRQRQRTRPLVDGGGLHEVPLLDHFQHVGEHLHVRREDLTRAGIDRAGSHGFGNRLRYPADHRMARVRRIPVGIVFDAGSILDDDGILEAGDFKGRQPILHTLFDRSAPTCRYLAADIKDNRLHRLRKLSAGVSLLQPKAGDQLTIHHVGRFSARVILIGNCKVAYARVGVAQRQLTLAKLGTIIFDCRCGTIVAIRQCIDRSLSVRTIAGARSFVRTGQNLVSSSNT